MQAYTQGTQVVVTIQLVQDGGDGKYLDAQSVDFRLIDTNDQDIIPRGPVSSFVVGDTEVVITIPAISNNIASTTETRDMRVVELFVNDGSGEIKIEHYYIIEKTNLLIEGVNSFQGYGKSLLTALTLNKISAWDSATKEARTNAMIQARRVMGSLVLRNYFGEISQSVFVDTNYKIGDITLLTQEQFVALPQNLKDALCRAQILQADYLLKDDDNEAMRDSGIISVSAGEAKKMFKDSKAYRPLVCKRALDELSRWYVGGLRIGR